MDKSRTSTVEIRASYFFNGRPLADMSRTSDAVWWTIHELVVCKFVRIVLLRPNGARGHVAAPRT